MVVGFNKINNEISGYLRFSSKISAIKLFHPSDFFPHSFNLLINKVLYLIVFCCFKNFQSVFNFLGLFWGIFHNNHFTILHLCFVSFGGICKAIWIIYENSFVFDFQSYDDFCLFLLTYVISDFPLLSFILTFCFYFAFIIVLFSIIQLMKYVTLLFL